MIATDTLGIDYTLFFSGLNSHAPNSCPPPFFSFLFFFFFFFGYMLECSIDYSELTDKEKNLKPGSAYSRVVSPGPDSNGVTKVRNPI